MGPGIKERKWPERLWTTGQSSPRGWGLYGLLWEGQGSSPLFPQGLRSVFYKLFFLEKTTSIEWSHKNKPTPLACSPCGEIKTRLGNLFIAPAKWYLKGGVSSSGTQAKDSGWEWRGERKPPESPNLRKSQGDPANSLGSIPCTEDLMVGLLDGL